MIHKYIVSSFYNLWLHNILFFRSRSCQNELFIFFEFFSFHPCTTCVCVSVFTSVELFSFQHLIVVLVSSSKTRFIIIIIFSFCHFIRPYGKKAKIPICIYSCNTVKHSYVERVVVRILRYVFFIPFLFSSFFAVKS